MGFAKNQQLPSEPFCNDEGFSTKPGFQEQTLVTLVLIRIFPPNCGPKTLSLYQRVLGSVGLSEQYPVGSKPLAIEMLYWAG